MDDAQIRNLQTELEECLDNINICEQLLCLKIEDFCSKYKEFPTYPVGLVGAEKALELITGKWKHAILMRLLKHPSLRYSAIKRELKEFGITDFMLSSTLNELVDDKLITKAVYAEVPVRVEYSVTTKTVEMWLIVLKFSHWYNKYRRQEIEEELKKIGMADQ